METETTIKSLWNRTKIITFFKWKFYLSYGRIVDYKIKESIKQ